MSTAKFDTLRDADGNNPSTALQIQQGRAKAWFNLNGTGTIAARDTYNVSSFVDNGTGDYTANFTVPRPSVNYVISGTAVTPSVTLGIVSFPYPALSDQAVGYCRMGMVATTGGFFDPVTIQIAVDGD